MMQVPGMRRVHSIPQRALRSADIALDLVGLRQSQQRRTSDASAYWSDELSKHWKANSHWRHNGAFSDKTWQAIGAQHLEIFQRFARALSTASSPRRVVEWGAGGGANAVHFAPVANEFVAVDVSQESLTECVRQVKTVCSTPVTTVLANVDAPENAAAQISPCDLFLCLYVLELVPSPEYGLRLMRIAASLLEEGGLAIVQIKYRTGQTSTRSRGRNYVHNLANMTTYAIDEFWSIAQECGLRPELIQLVPENELDSRYAYFALTR